LVRADPLPQEITTSLLPGITPQSTRVRSMG